MQNPKDQSRDIIWIRMLARQLNFDFDKELRSQFRNFNLKDIRVTNPNPLSIAESLEPIARSQETRESLRDFGKALIRATTNHNETNSHQQIGLNQVFKNNYEYSKLKTAIEDADIQTIKTIIEPNPSIFQIDFSYSKSKYEGSELFKLAFEKLATPNLNPQANETRLEIAKFFLHKLPCLLSISNEFACHTAYALTDIATKKLQKNLIKDLVDFHSRHSDDDCYYQMNQREKYQRMMHDVLCNIRDRHHEKEKWFDPNDHESVKAYIDLLRFLIIEKRVPIAAFKGYMAQEDVLLKSEQDGLKARLNKEDHYEIDELYQMRKELE